MAGATQALVRQTMLDAGGYWRPLAAVARLLEELGELAELLDPPAHPADPTDPADRADLADRGDELAGEFADLWIITAALGDQFLVELPEPRTLGGKAPTGKPSAAAILRAAGEIARVVNYYDGPKTPRSASVLPALGAAVPAFHVRLGELAGELGVHLAAAVSSMLDWIRGRDMERFERDMSDPSTAPCLELFRAADPATASLRLWGTPETSPETILHTVRSFARAAGPERFDGYVLDPRRQVHLFGIEELGLEAQERGEFLLLVPGMLLSPADDPA
jgi:hypothetical protein